MSGQAAHTDHQRPSRASGRVRAGLVGQRGLEHLQARDVRERAQLRRVVLEARLWRDVWSGAPAEVDGRQDQAWFGQQDGPDRHPPPAYRRGVAPQARVPRDERDPLGGPQGGQCEPLAGYAGSAQAQDGRSGGAGEQPSRDMPSACPAGQWMARMIWAMTTKQEDCRMASSKATLSGLTHVRSKTSPKHRRSRLPNRGHPHTRRVCRRLWLSNWKRTYKDQAIAALSALRVR